MTSGGSRRRECLKPAKKRALCRPKRCAAQVLACLSTVEPPPRRERRFAFPGSEVFGTGTLPVGFQGRSALVAEGEIPDSYGRILRSFNHNTNSLVHGSALS